MSELENMLGKTNSDFNFQTERRSETLNINSSLKQNTFLSRFKQHHTYNNYNNLDFFLNELIRILGIKTTSMRIREFKGIEDDKEFHEIFTYEIKEKLDTINQDLVKTKEEELSLELELTKKEHNLKRGEYTMQNINKIIVNYENCKDNDRFLNKWLNESSRQNNNQDNRKEKRIYFSEESGYVPNIGEEQVTDSQVNYDNLISYDNNHELMFSGHIKILEGPKKGQYERVEKVLMHPFRYYITDTGKIEQTTIDYNTTHKDVGWINSMLILLDGLKKDILKKKEELIANSIKILDEKIKGVLTSSRRKTKKQLYRRYLECLPKEETYNWEILKKISNEFDDDNTNLLSKFFLNEFKHLIQQDHSQIPDEQKLYTSEKTIKMGTRKFFRYSEDKIMTKEQKDDPTRFQPGMVKIKIDGAEEYTVDVFKYFIKQMILNIHRDTLTDEEKRDPKMWYGL